MSRTKLIVYGALLAAGAGLGLPELRRHLDAEPRELPVELDADADPREVDRASPGGLGPERDGSGSRRRGPAIAATTESDVIPSATSSFVDRGSYDDELGDVLAGLESALSPRSSVELERLATAWERPTSNDLPELQASVFAEAHEVWTDLVGPLELRGVLYTPEAPRALLGDLVVRVGDELVPGRLGVVAIEPRALTLRFDGVPVRVELPPFRPRAPIPKFGFDELVDSSPGGAPRGGSAASTASTESGSGALSELSSVLQDEIEELDDAIDQ